MMIIIQRNGLLLIEARCQMAPATLFVLLLLLEQRVNTDRALSSSSSSSSSSTSKNLSELIITHSIFWPCLSYLAMFSLAFAFALALYLGNLLTSSRLACLLRPHGSAKPTVTQA